MPATDPRTGRPVKISTPYSTPDPIDALATLLGVDEHSSRGEVTPMESRDPSLALGRLRNNAMEELSTRDSRSDPGTNIHGLGGNTAAVQQEMNADPYTGVAATKKDDAAFDHTRELAEFFSPMEANKRAIEQGGKERLAGIEHPNQNVSPFAQPGVSNATTPGGVPVPASQGNPSPVAQNGAINAPHGVPAPEGVDPTKWAQLTADLDPDTASKVSGALQYNLPIPSGNALARPEWSRILGRVAQIDPKYDAKQYDSRKAYLTDFAKGTTSKAVQSLDTVMHHLDTYNSAAEGMKNTGSHAYNSLANKIQEVGSFPELKSFEDAANAVSGELSNVFKQSGATDQEIRSWRDELSSSNTPDEFKAKLQTLTSLIKGRMEAVGKHYSDVMGKPAPNFLSNESQAIWQKFQGEGGDQQQQQQQRKAIRGGGFAVLGPDGQWRRE